MEETQTQLSCFQCHKNLTLGPGQKIPKNEECPYCYASLHSCRMCSFYDQSAYNECREPSAERIVEKEKANFCDFFVLKGPSGSSAPDKENLKNKFDSLFKN